ncbi:hypothetical protein HID58_021241 [Brassica napus]|uniref:Uncharacterized protein n=1 Tax=Brassica napus TaxID=3708 RepID=A0ABQ8CVV5_BRANA|nr:hypothetical protein HID58_021241 [Brassica napus]
MTRVELKEGIDLTEKEQRIFNLLLDALRENNCDTRLRVAGKDSEDIDIAIDNMTGRGFLEKFQNYIFLVNLFYNIHTGLVEDLTGRVFTRNDAMAGIDDLKSGRITTPVSAKTIFLEDPLRVLRPIRFVLANRFPCVIGARFGFTLDEELKEAASSEEINVALERKICRERIGNEVRIVHFLHSGCSLSRAYVEAMWSLILACHHVRSLLVTTIREERRFALCAAMFLPFRKTVYKDKKGKLQTKHELFLQVSVINNIFKVSMKRKSSDAETVRSCLNPQVHYYHGNKIYVINIHRAAERFLPLILPLQLMDPFHLKKLDWATDVLEHWESISLNDPEVPVKSKIRVVTGFLLRDIKDFWPVALLTSLLLYKDDDGMNLDFHLDKKRDIYLAIQDNIREMGKQRNASSTG